MFWKNGRHRGVVTVVFISCLTLSLLLLLRRGHADAKLENHRLTSPPPSRPSVVVPLIGLVKSPDAPIIVLTDHQQGLPVSCSVASGSSCVALSLGPFAVSCACQGWDQLKVNGVLVERVDVVSSSSRPHVFLAACTMTRGDDSYLVEWLTYHLRLGFQRIVLYSDEPDASKRATTRAVIHTFLTAGRVVFLTQADVWGDGLYRQFIALNHCMHTMINEADWVALFDVDEFIIPGRRTPDSIPDAIRRIIHNRGQVGSILMEQAFFGSQETQGGLGVARRFVRRERSFHAGDYEIGGKSMLVGKSITRPNMFRHMHTAHTVDLVSGSEVVKAKVDELRVNHYFCKSRREQAQREAQGNAWRSKLLVWEFCENEFNQVSDTELSNRMALSNSEG